MRLKEIVEILQKKYKKMLLSKAETAIELNVSQTTIDLSTLYETQNKNC